MIGETISHYRITAKLGAGGMGIVYKAQDLQLERNVALKFLPHDLALSDSDRERLFREARSASALDHPNIGVIYGIDKTADGQFFMVMAYYEGETLAQKLSGGYLALRQTMDWTCQIAAGLSAAHARNIIHRDIKPSNIIITSDGSARIVDFGLARVVATPSATMTGGTTGTLPYMSPEQILGEPVDQRCDVWALSVLLVQLVTGSHPFARENTTAMTFAILNQSPAAIDALPGLLQPIALRGLAKDQAHRYANAKEVLTDLESARSQFTSSGIALDEPTLTTQGPQSEAMKAALKEVATHASTPRWQASSAASQIAAATAAASSSRNRTAWYFFAALGLVILAAGSLLFSSVRRRAAAVLSGTAGAKHVAVLPFDNIGNDPANEAVAEGLMDSLTSKLSNLDSGQQSLWVVPSSVVRSRKITDPAAAGKDLGANLVVKGSIRRDAKIVYLTVNLIDAKDLRQVGSAQFDSSNGDLASLQDDAVAQLGRLMKINVTADMLRATGGRASPAAYESYLKALGLMQRYDKPGNLDQAVTALQDAVKTDAQFAVGYASLGEAYRLKNQVDPNPRWIEQASSMLERAVQLDNRLPSAYVTLGHLHSSLARYDLALQEFQKALAINPRDADATMGVGGAYERMGRLQDAEEQYKKAIALKPDYWDGHNSLANFYDRQGRYSDAIAEYERVIELTPDNPSVYSNLGAEYQSLGDQASLKKAESSFNKSIEISPTYAAYANLGNLYMDQRRYSEAAEATRRALELNASDYRVWINLLLDQRLLKDIESARNTRTKALSLLKEFLQQHPQDGTGQSWLAVLLSEDALRKESLRSIAVALAISPKDPLVLANVAEAFQNLNDRSQAIVYAQQSLRNGFAMSDLETRPALGPVLSDPSFHPSGKK
ncbi:MAG TPA: protein kinase [Candidatus Eisenbacteria bacterium]|nr:protein kinase [Candidatus Eisenbacteria bacterium]